MGLSERGNRIKFEISSFSILLQAVFITTALMSFFVSPSFSLDNPVKVYIGQATAEGVDVGLRVRFFYEMILIGAGGTVLFSFLLSQLESQIKVSLSNSHYFNFIAVTGICLSFLTSTGTQSGTTLGLLLITYIAGLFSFVSTRKRRKILSSIQTENDLVWPIAYSLILSFTCIYLLSPYTSVNSYIWVFGILFFCLLLLTEYLHRRYEIQVAGFYRGLVPVVVVPYLMFLSTEVQLFFKFNLGYYPGYKILFVGAIILFGVLFRWLFIKRIRNMDLNKIFLFFVGPSLLFLFVLLAYYQPVFERPEEYFELANPANAALRVFRFNEIPLLDFMSSHMLSEQWYVYLYYSIFNWNGDVDFLAYSFFNMFILYLIIYKFLNRVFGTPVFSVFFILLFPFLNDLFFAPVFIAVLLLFTLEWLVARQTSNRWFTLFCWVVGLILWRIDSGVVGVYSFLIFTPVYFWIRKEKILFRVMLSGLGKVLLLGALIFFTAGIFRPFNLLFRHLKEALHYLSGSQSHGLNEIMHTYTHQFFTIHVLLPFLVVLVVFYLLFLRRNAIEKKSKKFGYVSILFLALLFFVNAQRGLVRHGYAEQQEWFFMSTSILVLSLFAAFLLKNRFWGIHVFFGATFIFGFFFKFFPIENTYSRSEIAIRGNTFYTLNTEFTDDLKGRCSGTRPFASLKTFLDENLSQDQTFLDFSNTPMLYYYTERKIPGYFNQNLQNSIDNYLQKALLQDINPQKVPVVVYSSNPESWYDVTDGIPNGLRYYLIAEYIYENYRPFRVIDGKRIWLAKDQLKRFDSDSLVLSDYNLEYKSLAVYLGKHKQNNLSTFEVVSEGEVTRGDTVRIILDGAVKNLNHCWMELDFDSEVSGEIVQVNLDWNGNNGFSFVRKDEISNVYLLRLSNHYLWAATGVSEIIVTPGRGLRSYKILTDKKSEG